jgi:hypothetical protein
MGQVESVEENIDVNFKMKTFPAYNRFTIWRINLEQENSIDKKQKCKSQVLIGTWPAHSPDLNPCDSFSSEVV